MDSLAESGRRGPLRARLVPARFLDGADELTPARITGIYVAFGFLGLFVSDVLMVWYLSDPLLGRLQAVKGAVEVVLTGGLVFALTSWSRVAQRRTEDELRRQRGELQVLHRVLRHNLRNNLTVIRGQAERLRENAEDEEQASTCGTILEVADEIIHYTRQADELRRLTTEGETVTVDLAELVPAVVEDVPAERENVDVSVSVPPSARVRVSSLFEQALRELVENAVAHADPEEPVVSVTVEAGSRADGTTTVEVADNGPGLPPDVEQVLVEGEHSQLVHMDGMGLWLAYMTVVESRGELSIVRSGPEGTTFGIEVPTASELGRRGLFDRD